MILAGLSRDADAGIFLIEMKVVENKEKNEFSATHSADGGAFLSMVTETVDAALMQESSSLTGLFTPVVALADISQPEPLVMKQFVRKTDPPKNIETTHPNDEKVLAVKARLTKMMQPYGAARLEEYKQLILPYLDALKLDVAEIVASKEDEENPATVQDIAKHIHED
eukprot:g13533.t1